MGLALAREARRRGAAVCLILGPCSEIPRLAGVEVVPVVSAMQMRKEVLRRCARAQVIIAAAAVSDWRFKRLGRRKIKRGARPLRLTLIPNPDIIKEVARLRDQRGLRQVLVGFALETHRIVSEARRKLREKGLDLVVANGPQALEASGVFATILSRSGRARVLGKLPKARLARIIFSAVEPLLS